ncbi:hypothetical protein ACJX0J_027840 [Zea mays]
MGWHNKLFLLFHLLVFVLYIHIKMLLSYCYITLFLEWDYKYRLTQPISPLTSRYQLQVRHDRNKCGHIINIVMHLGMFSCEKQDMHEYMNFHIIFLKRIIINTDYFLKKLKDLQKRKQEVLQEQVLSTDYMMIYSHYHKELLNLSSGKTGSKTTVIHHWSVSLSFAYLVVFLIGIIQRDDSIIDLRKNLSWSTCTTHIEKVYMTSTEMSQQLTPKQAIRLF